MKKLFIAGVAMLFLSACTQEKTEPVVNDTDTKVEVSQSKDESSQEELNAKLKEEAVLADFVELNVENPPKGKKVYAEGTVSLLTEGVFNEFTLTTNEESGHGMYKIVLANMNEVEYKEGDIVKVYGGVTGKDEMGMPEILATIIEKVE